MRPDPQPCVYILASKRNGTLYTGVISSLLNRIHQHRQGLVRGFTSDYGGQGAGMFEQHPNEIRVRSAQMIFCSAGFPLSRE
jgi:putative endonuclease